MDTNGLGGAGCVTWLIVYIIGLIGSFYLLSLELKQVIEEVVPSLAPTF